MVKSAYISLMWLIILVVMIIACSNNDVVNPTDKDPNNSTVDGMQFLIPLYMYPNSDWDEIARANSEVPITVIINPNNGPGGGEPDINFKKGLQKLKNAGVTTLGYVHSDYGNRDIQEVKYDTDIYNQYFNIDGIYIDGVSSDTSKFSYYEELDNYIQSLPNLELVFFSPGTSTDEAYLALNGTVVIFEGDSNDWPAYKPHSYVSSYPAERFAVLIHTVLDITTLKSHIDTASVRNIGYVYLTNDFMPNPWDTLPDFWAEEIEHIKQYRQ